MSEKPRKSETDAFSFLFVWAYLMVASWALAPVVLELIKWYFR